MNSLHRLIPACVIALALTSTADAQIVNLNGLVHAVGTGVDQPVPVTLGPGTWTVTPLGVAGGGAYNSFSPWDSNSNCPTSCIPSSSNHGYLHRYAARVGTQVVIDPNATWNGLAYGNPLDALAAGIAATLVLTQSSVVEFYIPTGLPISDNRGGISLQISAPTPTTPDSWGRLKHYYR